jgi:hypothetical protein
MKRRGHSLVELIAVITGVSVVLGGAITLMTFVLRMNGDARDRTHTIASIGRLAQQFRRDVHEARKELKVEADGATDFDLIDGDAIRWGIDEHGGVYRWETGPKASRQTTYRLPQGSTAVLKTEKQRKSQIVRLLIESPGVGGPSLAIEALACQEKQMGAEDEK